MALLFSYVSLTLGPTKLPHLQLINDALSSGIDVGAPRLHRGLQIEDTALDLELTVRLLLEAVHDAEGNLAGLDGLVEPFLQHVVLVELLPLELAQQALEVLERPGGHLLLPVVLVELGLGLRGVGLELGEGVLEVGRQLDVRLGEGLADLPADGVELGVEVLALGLARDEAEPRAGLVLVRVVEGALQDVALEGLADVGVEVLGLEEDAQLAVVGDVDAVVREALVEVDVDGEDVGVGDGVEIRRRLGVAVVDELAEAVEGVVEVSGREVSQSVSLLIYWKVS